MQPVFFFILHNFEYGHLPLKYNKNTDKIEGMNGKWISVNTVVLKSKEV